MASVVRFYGGKRGRRGFKKSDVKAFGTTGEVHQKLLNLSAEEESGTQCVAVECVDIWKNTSGEGGSLVCN